MNRDRKILMIILYISVIALLSVINLIILKDRLSRSVTNREMLDKQYGKLNNPSVEVSAHRIDSLELLFEEERKRFFTREETDPYRLGLYIIDELDTSGMTVLQYRTLEQGDSFLLEFSIEGGVECFLDFWEDLYRNDRYYRIPLLTLKKDRAGISATFRIGYAFYE